MLQSTLRKLDRYTFKRKGPLTCSTKSVYSHKEDILSEEPDDEDSIQEDAVMDEHEILSERSAAAEEEEQRSLQGDMELENPTQLPFLRPDQESIQQQNKLIIKIAKLNYHNLMLIQEG